MPYMNAGVTEMAWTFFAARDCCKRVRVPLRIFFFFEEIQRLYVFYSPQRLFMFLSCLFVLHENATQKIPASLFF